MKLKLSILNKKKSKLEKQLNILNKAQESQIEYKEQIEADLKKVADKFFELKYEEQKYYEDLTALLDYVKTAIDKRANKISKLDTELKIVNTEIFKQGIEEFMY